MIWLTWTWGKLRRLMHLTNFEVFFFWDPNLGILSHFFAQIFIFKTGFHSKSWNTSGLKITRTSRFEVGRCHLRYAMWTFPQQNHQNLSRFYKPLWLFLLIFQRTSSHVAGASLEKTYPLYPNQDFRNSGISSRSLQVKELFQETI